MIGTQIGPYQVIDRLGAGGMGEVYRAHDTELHRDVAIKVLPDAVARDPERLLRFRREAQTLALLNHPHIAQIYRLEEIGGSVALVMELADGPTLADLIAAAASRGSTLPLADTIAIAKQIAQGLEVAHEKGLVHRDLKPANIKVARDGTVKILDFGLAKALAADTEAAAIDAANSPTLTAIATEAGVILGTASYMSPEQARGRPVDKRADIWAFGTVLYEMLTGHRAFEGDSVSDILANVLKTEPNWQLLPPTLPEHVAAILHRCLERDVSRRLRDIGEARLALEGGASVVMPSPSGRTSGLSRARSWSSAGLWMAIAAVAVAIAAAALLFAPRSTPRESLELAIAAPADATFQIGSNSGNVIVSPDGTKIAFVASIKGPMLWVRSLGADDARALPDTQGASNPFWSPDSKQIGFFAAGQLKKIDIAGGLPEVLAPAPAGRGGAWGKDGTVLFVPIAGGTISRVSASGGEPAPLTKLDQTRGENAHYWPSFLPGGKQFLYFIRSTRLENNGIYLGSLDGGAPIRLVTSLSSGIAAIAPSTGALHLLWVRDGDLLAQPLDATAGTLRGEARTIAQGVRVEDSQRLSFVSASANGLVAWATQRAADTVLSQLDRDGKRLGTLDVEPGHLMQPAVSPDGQRVLFTRVEKGSADIWLHDRTTGATRRMTSDPGYDEHAAWTRDGRAFTYLSDEGEERGINLVPYGGGGTPSLLFKGMTTGGELSPDGQFLILSLIRPGTGIDTFAMHVGDPSRLDPLEATRASDLAGAMSPDGRWVMFATDASGTLQVSLRRFIRDGPRVRLGDRRFPIGSLAGDTVAWRPDGKAVTFTNHAGDVVTVPVTLGAEEATVGTPTRLFTLPPGDSTWSANADGTYFVVVESPFAAAQTLRLLTNWDSRLR